jgi:hypothetical protein
MDALARERPQPSPAADVSTAQEQLPERFAAEFSGTDRTVAEFLLAEVLDRQSEEVRLLLLRTSVLERVSGQLADAPALVRAYRPGSRRRRPKRSARPAGFGANAWRSRCGQGRSMASGAGRLRTSALPRGEGQSASSL